MNFGKKIKRFAKKLQGSKYALAGGIGSKSESVKKIEKVIDFNLETPGKKIVIVFRSVFRTQSNIYDGAFLGK